MPPQPIGGHPGMGGQMGQHPMEGQGQGGHGQGHPMGHRDWVEGITAAGLRGMFPNAAAVEAAIVRFGSDEQGLNRAMVFLVESGEGGGGGRGGGGAGGAGAGGGVIPPEDEEADKWEPSSGLLGSRLNLRWGLYKYNSVYP
jgi:hypothetical protein